MRGPAKSLFIQRAATEILFTLALAPVLVPVATSGKAGSCKPPNRLGG